MKNGKLIGIVSRANLVQALAALRKDIPSEATVEDATLRTTILAEFRSNLEIAASQVNVIVHGGTVELWGEVNSLDEKDAVRVAAETIPGVVAVEDHTSLSKFHHGI